MKWKFNSVGQQFQNKHLQVLLTLNHWTPGDEFNVKCILIYKCNYPQSFVDSRDLWSFKKDVLGLRANQTAHVLVNSVTTGLTWNIQYWPLPLYLSVFTTCTLGGGGTGQFDLSFNGL